ncbi:DUF5681 domain-containing protein [Sphingomicrobium arenosum]|uniref:DUF5681 domain-containing protein n=1 Tax=Sphingomicrobium arenosum TaxID=2233861 RepID=UPI002240E915|nr:DUF5681 domain-containing protein [Sphingomicrobium arenosum]
MPRWEKGQSGNPAGRPRKRRPNISAFDIIFDKRITVSQNGEERELTVDEVLELRTYQDALKGSRMAIRQVLKMIERREKALVKRAPSQGFTPIKITTENDPRNADEAMLILGIAVPDPFWEGRATDERRILLSTWATQAAISRPGRKLLTEKDVDAVERCTLNSGDLQWPRGGKR